MKLVDKILAMKRRQGPTATRRARDDSEEADFGEDGLDIDTYEARYGGGADLDDDEEGATSGGPLGDDSRDNNRAGGRRGARGTGRGGYRGNRRNG